MPIPFILAGMAIAAAGYGVKKGVDASDKNKDADNIVRWAKEDYESAKEQTESKQKQINRDLESFGKLKVIIFTEEIGFLVEAIKECKKSQSIFSNNKFIAENELKEMKASVDTSLEIVSGLASGGLAGALTGLGAYGAVGALASASTGTAIAGLSGAAATNATLAWLGGGSIAAGGGGMALGTAVLGGIVAGPLIAVGGMFMDSKAEKNLTEAKELESKSNEAIEQMKTMRTVLQGISDRVDELTGTLVEVRNRFNDTKELIQDKVQEDSSFCKMEEFKLLITFGKTLKNLLDIPVLGKDGTANEFVTSQIQDVLTHN